MSLYPLNLHTLKKGEIFIQQEKMFVTHIKRDKGWNKNKQKLKSHEDYELEKEPRKEKGEIYRKRKHVKV